MADVTPLTRCTVQRADTTFCDRPSVPSAPYPICYKHAGDLLQFFHDVAHNLAEADPITYKVMTWTAALIEKLSDGRPAAGRPEPNLIYYVRIGDIIKIGATANLKRRMNQYPPNAELLATEPGDYAVESDRLSRFAQYRRSGNEWFDPAPPLMEHIAKLQAAAA